MLKQRVIAVLVLRRGWVVQSFSFNRYLPVGSLPVAADFLNQWGVDEIVVLDIDATVSRRGFNREIMQRCTRCCHVPLTVGGGISSVADIEKLIHAGADKISFNAAAFENLTLVNEGARNFGTQCIVVSMDARRMKDGGYEVFTHSGVKATGLAPMDAAMIMQDNGAGEILLNSIDRDGSRQGLDLDLIKEVAGAVSIPVVACGGVGFPAHFVEGLTLGISGVAAANYFHHSEHSVIVTKSFINAQQSSVRLDTRADYTKFSFTANGRIAKADDDVLEKQRFIHIPEERI